MNKAAASVIVSSYNQPNALRLVLAGLAAQTRLDFEVVLADDGSDKDTEELVADFARGAPFPVRFVTQEHTKFRKSRILNSAILASQGEAIIFTDGDCVPFRNWADTHIRRLRPEAFCVGGQVSIRLDDALTLTASAIAAGTHERFLTAATRLKHTWIDVCSAFYRLGGRRDRPKLKGGNFSTSRASLLAVDGFDETYEGFGWEDSDIRNRLRNAGCRGISLWRRALMCHLDHGLDPRRLNPAVRRGPPDKEFYRSSRNRIRALKGLSGHQAKEGGP